jgi:hypothetical protein
LLSFAQFEREIAGERIRDKIAASKKKGMWMGGMPPLGYDVRDRKLVVNDEEAQTVRYIYQRYLALNSVHALRDELAATDIKSKRRTRPDGTPYGGQIFGRGALYAMLQNRLYRGEVAHKGSVYPGEHPAIIDQVLWDKAHAVLAQNRVKRATGAYAKQPSLLAGLVFDANGGRLTPTHAVKKGRRYRYYVTTSLVRGNGKASSAGWRIPAGDLESLVIDRLRSFLTAEEELLDAIAEASIALELPLIQRARRTAKTLSEKPPPHELKMPLTSLLTRVEIQSDAILLKVCRQQLARLLAGQGPESSHCIDAARPEDITLKIPARLQRAGREMRMVVQNSDDQRPPDSGLLRLLSRAHNIQRRLTKNPDLSVHDFARAERVSAAYIYSILRLPWLAPDITTADVNGRSPPQLTARRLMRLSAHLPLAWAEQRRLLGFG